MAETTGAKKEEELQVKTLAEFVRLRPDTHVGRVAKVAGLRWVIGWKTALSALMLVDAPIKGLGAEEARRLRAQQRLLFLSDDVSVSKPKSKPSLKRTLDTVDDAASSSSASTGELGTSPVEASVTEPAPVALKDAGVALALKDAGVARVLVEVSPALEKIIDEILQNALDRQHKDDAMKRIDVHVDAAAGRITVRNDGMGMPVPKPARTNARVPDAYWPTIVCTVDMAGGNFAAAAGGHYSGGRNGIGMKATNILSTYFRFEVGDATNHLHFAQEWREGMTVTGEPVVRQFKPARGYVEVTFDPDMAFFGETAGAGFPAHVTALIHSRVWEIAAHARAIVTLNGARLPLRASVAGLASLFRDAVAPSSGPRVTPLTAKHLLEDGRVVWDVTLLPARDGVPADIVAFVNGIRCNRGAHVEHLLKTVGAAMLDAVRRKAKRPDLKFISGPQVPMRKNLFFNF